MSKLKVTLNGVEVAVEGLDLHTISETVRALRPGDCLVVVAPEPRFRFNRFNDRIIMERLVSGISINSLSLDSAKVLAVLNAADARGEL